MAEQDYGFNYYNDIWKSNDLTLGQNEYAGMQADGTLGTTSAAFDTNTGSTGPFDTFNSTMASAGKIASGVASLGQIYVGLKSLDIAKDELKLKKDQWKMSKEELQHLQGTRKHITQSYMA